MDAYWRASNYLSVGQIYLFDNVGRRLRRLSVDPSGVPGTACSWSPALSGDGTVLAYAGKSANLVDDGIAEEANPQHVDVFSQAWTCNDAGRCRRRCWRMIRKSRHRLSERIMRRL
jgi:hypothetical protein